VTVAVTASLGGGLGTEVIKDDGKLCMVVGKFASGSILHVVFDVHRTLRESIRLRIDDFGRGNYTWPSFSGRAAGVIDSY
jgi:hypothetical protein